jgi:hypothetical protein
MAVNAHPTPKRSKQLTSCGTARGGMLSLLLPSRRHTPQTLSPPVAAFNAETGTEREAVQTLSISRLI